VKLQFINQHPNLCIPSTDNLSSWLVSVIQEEGYNLGRLSYTFLNDDDLLKINVDFLDHHTLTDVITFDYNVDNYIVGEIYISLDRVFENAESRNISFSKESHRIMVHGLLHLLGYKDKEKDAKNLMTEKEDYYLSLQPSFFR